MLGFKGLNKLEHNRQVKTGLGYVSLLFLLLYRIQKRGDNEIPAHFIREIKTHKRHRRQCIPHKS